MQRRTTVKESAMSAGTRLVIKGLVYLIIGAVSAYGDGAFIWLNLHYYTNFIIQICVVAGAVCTSLSIISLVFGKEHWFRPGAQLIVAYLFTGAEVIVNILNALTAIHPESFTWWLFLSPGGPFLAIVGWVLLLQLDTSTVARHADMEMEDEKRQSEREYEKARHEAQMDLKHSYLGSTKSHLEAELHSPAIQQALREHARRLAQATMQEISGLSIGPSYLETSALPLALPEPPQQPLQQPTQHVEQVFTDQQQEAGESADPLALRLWHTVIGKNGNGAKPPAQE